VKVAPGEHVPVNGHPGMLATGADARLIFNACLKVPCELVAVIPQGPDVPLTRHSYSPGVEGVPLMIAVPFPLSWRVNPRSDKKVNAGSTVIAGAGFPVATTRNDTGKPAVPVSASGEMIASCVATLIESVRVTGLPDPDAVSSS
jgi:hypothetical protein